MTDTGVRLVIWDLDETFWDGTLTEGGVRYRCDRHDIVVELARRGVISSICSKNDFGPVRDLLVEKGAWDYFVFPSLDWTAKGERIRDIIEAAQLRPQNVVFVDDNAHNRAQAEALVPALRTFDVDAVAGFLDNPDFRGKADPELTRLKQYKLLEARRSERQAFAGGAAEFLRHAQVEVEIVADFDGLIDRAVELVNRTNQLNFTKRRLPDDPAAAAAQLASEISGFNVRAGLVRARDRYGDYGVVGFFLLAGLLAQSLHLRHFCFSCRVLGMGVEQYVYDLLGRPPLHIVGPVASDPFASADWVHSGYRERAARRGGDGIGEVRIRGGCEFEVLDFMFRERARRVVGEYQVRRGIYNVPVQHSLTLAMAARPLAGAELAALRPLDLAEPYAESRFFDPCPEPTLLVLSPALDAVQDVWRHRATGLMTPVRFRLELFARDPANPATPAEDLREFERVNEILEREFEPASWPFEPALGEARRLILDSVPENALLIVVLPNDRRNVDGQPEPKVTQTRSNENFRALGRGRDNVVFLDVNELIRDIGEVQPYYLHYQRVVYVRMFERIAEIWRSWTAKRATAELAPA